MKSKTVKFSSYPEGCKAIVQIESDKLGVVLTLNNDVTLILEVDPKGFWRLNSCDSFGEVKSRITIENSGHAFSAEGRELGV